MLVIIKSFYHIALFYVVFIQFFVTVFFKIEFCLTKNQPTDETLPDHFYGFHENRYNF
jgi:hypothetical protein